MSRTILILIAVSAVVLSLATFVMSARSSTGTTGDSAAYSFIAWGDMRPGSTALHATYSVGWQHVRDEMAATPHAFEIVAGDMVNVDAANDSLSTIDAKYADLFSAMGATLSIPKSYVIGNHEAVGSSAAAAASWEKNIRPAHHDVFAHGAGTAAAPRVIVINLSTYEPGNHGSIGFVAEGSASNAAQGDWLVGQLRAHAQDPHTFLVVNMHHPLADPKPGEAYDTDTEEREALETLFDKYGVDLVVAGHVHAYVRHMMPDGTPYIVQGMAGAGPVEASYAAHTSPGSDAIRLGSADSAHEQYGFTTFEVTTTGRLFADTYIAMETDWAWHIGDSFEVVQQDPLGVSPSPSPTATASTTPTPSPTPTATVGPLISKGRKARASSSRPAHGARYANDGRATTRWTALGARYPQWWRVDLGRVRSIGRVKVRFYDPASSPRTYAFRIQRSNDRRVWKKWTPGQSARYIRVYIKGLSVGNGRASIIEARVFARTP